MITQSVVVTDPRNGKMAISNALSVSGSLKLILQDISDLPMRETKNNLFLAGLNAISSELGYKFKLRGDEGPRQSITTRREQYSQRESTAIQNLNEAWSDIKKSWIDGLDSQRDHPKYKTYVDIIGDGNLVKKGNTFYLISGTYGRLVILTS